MSKSTMPIVPTPAAARYSEAGEPSPPAPMRSAFEPSRRPGPRHRPPGSAGGGCSAASAPRSGRSGSRSRTRRSSSPGSRSTSRRRSCSPSPTASGRRTASERRRRNRGSPARHGRARCPRSAARCSDFETWWAPGRWPCSHSGRLADVDDRCGADREGVDLLGADFFDLRAGLAKEVGVGLWHGVRDSDDRQAGSRSGARAVRGGSRSVAAGGTSRRHAGGRHLQRRSIRVAVVADVMRLPRPGSASCWSGRPRRGRRARAGGCRG